MKRYVIPIIIPSSKENSTLTNQEVIKKQENQLTKEDAKKIIEEHLEKINNQEYKIEIVFSGLDEVSQKELLEIAYEYIKAKKINEIKIMTKANYINKEFLKMLRKFKVKTVELEIQSTNEYILKKAEVKYSIKDIENAVKLIKRYRFNLGIQMMIGLPESTKRDDINTAKAIIKMKPKIVSVTPILVLKGTPLEKEYQEKRYKPLALVQAVEICEELVELFNNKKIKVIAIGYGLLDNNLEQLEIAENVIEGPFHPAFRQLVESGLWYNAIVNKIKKLNVKVIQVEVIVNPIDVNNVIGYKQENITKLKDTYDVDLKVTSDNKIKQGRSKLKI